MKLLLTALLLSLAVSASMAAEIGMTAGKIWSTHDDIGSPAGFGLDISQLVWGHSRVQLEYSRFRSEGHVWARLRWPDGPQEGPEPLLSSVNTLGALDIGFLIGPGGTTAFQFEFGPGVSINKLRCERKCAEDASLHASRSTTRFGIALLSRISINPVSRTSFAAFISLKAKTIFGKEEPLGDSWQPYRDDIGLVQFCFGVAYRFR